MLLSTSAKLYSIPINIKIAPCLYYILPPKIINSSGDNIDIIQSRRGEDQINNIEYNLLFRRTIFTGDFKVEISSIVETKSFISTFIYRVSLFDFSYLDDNYFRARGLLRRQSSSKYKGRRYYIQRALKDIRVLQRGR